MGWAALRANASQMSSSVVLLCKMSKISK